MKILTEITLLCIIIFMGIGCVTNGDGSATGRTPEEIRQEIIAPYNKAVELYREGNYAEALSLSKNDVLRKESTFFPAYILRGRIYFEMKEYEKAVDEFHHYYKNYEYGERWNRYLNREEYPAVIELADAYWYEGWAYNEMEKLEEALECHKRALQLYEKHEFQNRLARIHVAIGDDYYALEKYEDAVGSYLQGLACNESNIWAHGGLVLSYKKLGQDLDMLRHLARMINMEPETTLSWYKERAEILDWTENNAGLKSIFLESEIKEENIWVLKEIMDLHEFARDG